MRELKKSTKQDLVFHSFNYGRDQKITWRDLVALHFGDAGNNNRPDGGSTGGYLTGFAAPEILGGNETKVSILDWRSWKLDRPAKGTNGTESQAIFEAEDKGWKCRLLWNLLNGEELTRSNAPKPAASVESLLITDSRGLYDAITSSDSPLLGMNNSRTGIEATAVQKGFEMMASAI